VHSWVSWFGLSVLALTLFVYLRKQVALEDVGRKQGVAE
jgi:hypothetical protein